MTPHREGQASQPATPCGPGTRPSALARLPELQIAKRSVSKTISYEQQVEKSSGRSNSDAGSVVCAHQVSWELCGSGALDVKLYQTYVHSGEDSSDWLVLTALHPYANTEHAKHPVPPVVASLPLLCAPRRSPEDPPRLVPAQRWSWNSQDSI